MAQKDRARRFYNNLNSKTVKSVGELVSAIALLHNVIKVDGVGGVIPVDSARVDYCLCIIIF